ncbi:restriction endonuclease subunit S, partial [Clostridium sp. WILCCON 0269]
MKERKLPEGWQFRCLDNCYNIKKGKKVELIEEYSKELIRYIQIDDLRNNDNIKYCNNDKTYIKANKEDIIIAWDGANAGTIGYALEGAIGSTLAILRSKVKYINTKFIGIYLKSKFRYLRDNCTGATIPHIQRKILENILLPIPPPGTQEKIVQVLEKAEKALEKKKEAIRLLDDLVKSRFIEMFGNPFSNSKGWNKDTIGSV